MTQQVINLKDIEYTDTINKKFVFDNEQSSLTLISFKAGSQRAIMPAKTPHGLKAVKDTKMLLLRPKHVHN